MTAIAALGKPASPTTWLIGDGLLGWQLGQSRDLKEHTQGDAWLRDKQWTKERVLKELLADHLKAVRSLGGYRSRGFGRVDIAVQEIKMTTMTT
jgi:hypothetical protein